MQTESNNRPTFRGGKNIAMKVPSHRYEATLAFYEETLGLDRVERQSSPAFAFGDVTLWIDRVPHLSQSELWLEIENDDPEQAGAWLQSQGVPRGDGLEPLPDGFKGFWILAPSDIVHLVALPGQ